jgi:regulatory protein
VGELDAAQARALALAWLARREYGTRELHLKLQQKGCAEALAAQVVARLVAEGVLSDERYVETLIRARRRRGYGPLRIRRELEEKGVDEALIDRFLDPNDRAWFAEAVRVRQRKYGERLPRDVVARARQWRFLQYRGFTPDQIRRACGARGDESR